MLVLAPHLYQNLFTEASTTPSSRYAVQTYSVLIARVGLGSIGCLGGSSWECFAVYCCKLSASNEGRGCRFVFSNRHPCVWNLDQIVVLVVGSHLSNREAAAAVVAAHLLAVQKQYIKAVTRERLHSSLALRSEKAPCCIALLWSTAKANVVLCSQNMTSYNQCLRAMYSAQQTRYSAVVAETQDTTDDRPRVINEPVSPLSLCLFLSAGGGYVVWSTRKHLQTECNRQKKLPACCVPVERE